MLCTLKQNCAFPKEFEVKWFLFIFFLLQNNLNLLGNDESDRISSFYRFVKIRQLERGLVSDPSEGGMTV